MSIDELATQSRFYQVEQDWNDDTTSATVQSPLQRQTLMERFDQYESRLVQVLVRGLHDEPAIVPSEACQQRARVFVVLAPDDQLGAPEDASLSSSKWPALWAEKSRTPWTEAKNERRYELIDRELDGTITPGEQAELDQLQNELFDYQDELAPLPLDELREVHSQLLRKAARAEPD